MAAKEKLLLITSIFIAGLCSIIYELLISTTSSYFLGDSVKQFSITIGTYMAAMGVGSFLSRIFRKDFLLRFIEVELLLGVIGGCSVPILYFVFANASPTAFSGIMLLLISLIGILTGMEIPLLTLILKEHYPLQINLSNVLSVDYIGALAATLLFPFLLLPFVGVFLSSVLFGLVNVGLGIVNLWYFRHQLGAKQRTNYIVISILIVTGFAFLLAGSQQLLGRWHDSLYKDRIVYTKTTPYQTLVLTKGGEDLRLYIDRVIQFSSVDEYRYHEALIHPAMSMAPYRKRVLILGGGEGLAAREVLKYPDVESVFIVDIDPAIFELARTNSYITQLNANSLDHPKVTTIPEDAFVFLMQYYELFDLIIADLPDPTNESLTRLYSSEFYQLIKKRLTPNGLFVTQATGPFHTRDAFWCIQESVRAVPFAATLPYHAYVPSFGDWGFVIGAKYPIDTSSIQLQVPTKFLSNELFPHLFHFEKDLMVDTVQVNTLDRPILLDYYLEDWRRWSRKQ
ncbi:MAG: polyamine aminopropyltransferase [Bacteroidota bacterium]